MVRMVSIALLMWLGFREGRAQSPAYTLHSSSRVVLTDVVVSDRDGNPVHGLVEKDFQLLDNGKEQRLSSFEEHVGATLEPVGAMPRPPGVFSNRVSLHLPPVVNVMLIDTTRLTVVDEMVLYLELKRFMDGFAGGQPLALFLRTGPECLLLQDFTTDRVVLAAALKKAIPRFHNPDASDLFRTNDVAALHQMSLYLADIPGRKNLIWFSGGSAFGLNPDGAVNLNMRPVYDELEADRISVYPIDARGLTVSGGGGQEIQHAMMADVAAATGGTAYYNQNRVGEIAARVIETDRSFYTLTYAPHDFVYDNKWHSITVKVAGGYSLSYRRGYFADAANTGVKPEAGATRTRLFADGSRLKVPAETSSPIVFDAKVERADLNALRNGAVGAPSEPPRHGMDRLKVTFTVPASSFLIRQVNGSPKIEVGAATLLLNREGRRVGQRADNFSVTINTQKLGERPDGTVRVSQEVDASKGEHYLYLLVWDGLTNRRGFLEVPIQVPLPAETAQAEHAVVE